MSDYCTDKNCSEADYVHWHKGNWIMFEPHFDSYTPRFNINVDQLGGEKDW